MYATYEDYIQLYGDGITEQEFVRHEMQAERYMDIATTGIDNVAKLKTAFPEANRTAIMYCACQMVNLAKQISDAEAACGYVAGSNGLQGKTVSSISAGNESISFSSGSTAITEAAFNAEKKGRLLLDTAKEYLSGLEDANGVNLLYMGAYPRGIVNVS